MKRGNDLYFLNYTIYNILLLLYLGFAFDTLFDQLLVTSLEIFMFPFGNFLFFRVLLSKALQLVGGILSLPGSLLNHRRVGGMLKDEGSSRSEGCSQLLTTVSVS